MNFLDIFTPGTERDEIRNYLLNCQAILGPFEGKQMTNNDASEVRRAYDVAVIPAYKARKKLKLGDPPIEPTPPTDPPGLLQGASNLQAPIVRVSFLAKSDVRLLVEVLQTGEIAVGDDSSLGASPAADPPVKVATQEEIGALKYYDKSVVNELEVLRMTLATKNLANGAGAVLERLKSILA